MSKPLISCCIEVFDRMQTHEEYMIRRWGVVDCPQDQGASADPQQFFKM